MDSSPSLPASRRQLMAACQEDSPPPAVPSSLSGSKRAAPSLLPPFEPLSSSPGLPRPLKRQNTRGSFQSLLTPVPTSSTGILLLSSPSQLASSRRRLSGQLLSAVSDGTAATSVSERVPLTAVPVIELPENGEAVSLGRSSSSSQVQLSANRLISRVHVLARYIASSGAAGSKIEIVCNGWNGLKLHCQGRTWELLKGDSFTSETPAVDVMIDVLDARVMIRWPRRGGENAAAGLCDSPGWDDSPSSQGLGGHSLLLQSSPLRRTARIASPESPTPAGRVSMSSSQSLNMTLALADDDRSRDPDGIQIYEDEPEDGESQLQQSKHARRTSAVADIDVGASMRTEATASFSSEPPSDAEDHNPDEENDPIIHSFGPFGADISGRMASIMSKSPKNEATKSAVRKRPRNTSPSNTLTSITRLWNATPSPSSPAKTSPPVLENGLVTSESEEAPLAPPAEVDSAIANYIINQLAFSRLSSTPLSTMMQNLPAEFRAAGHSREVLRRVVESTCIGIIRRQGKDAAGKPLESEYYYMPEYDDDEQRRAAVVDGLRKPSLRACRKQHKVNDGDDVESAGPAQLELWKRLTEIFQAILLEASAHSISCRSLLCDACPITLPRAKTECRHGPNFLPTLLSPYPPAYNNVLAYWCDEF